MIQYNLPTRSLLKYTEVTQRTDLSDHDYDFKAEKVGDSAKAIHYTLGVVSEIGELVEALDKFAEHYDVCSKAQVKVRRDEEENLVTHIAEEAGDILWYLSNLALLYEHEPNPDHFFLRDCNLESVESEVLINMHRVFLRRSSDLLDGLKASLFYSKETRAIVVNAIDAIYSTVVTVASLFDMTIEQILAINEAKLRVRYPDKFTESAARIRNIPNEVDEMTRVIKGIENGSTPLSSTE